MAPETNKAIAGKPGRKSDMWSVGILVLEMSMNYEESYLFFSNSTYWDRLCKHKELPKAPASLKCSLLQWVLSKTLVYNPVKKHLLRI